jgi:hypothetical protein
MYAAALMLLKPLTWAGIVIFATRFFNQNFKIMPYIDDLSYSNLVNIIQGEEIKGADVLNSIAHEMQENDKIIDKLESDLARAKGRRDTLIEGSKRVLQHLKKEAPLVVQRQSYIVVVTNENISIERNVI